MTRARRRPRHIGRRRSACAPATPVASSAERAQVEVIAYGGGALVDRHVLDLAQIPALFETHRVVWVTVDRLTDAATINGLGKLFQLHPVALNDLMHLHERPKSEPFDNYINFVARMIRSGMPVDTEQVSLFVGKNFVLTFLEDPGDVFDKVRQRLRVGGCSLTDAGPGGLLYALLDALVHAYFPVVEQLGDELETIEDEVLERPSPHVVAKIHEVKRELRTLRRSIWPLREALGNLLRERTPLIDDATHVYLRDCHDHTVQLLDLVEMYRELGADLSDLYLSSQGNRMNEIMKVLTVISTIFLPMSFIAGLYGMNFDPQASGWNMPELHWPWGYPYALVLMFLSTLAMLEFFRRKGWLQSLNALRPTDGLSGDNIPAAGSSQPS